MTLLESHLINKDRKEITKMKVLLEHKNKRISDLQAMLNTAQEQTSKIMSEMKDENNYSDSHHLQGSMKFSTQISPLLNLLIKFIKL